tara:strand:+ start:2433 stop:3662 length:1230 start_codon:yes stop_codon:yes gene_type:complete
MRCRSCKSIVKDIFIDLGKAPPSNSYLSKSELNKFEKWFPLRVLVCKNCFLVQTEDFIGADDIFSDNYAYFSSYSSSWLKHSKEYVDNVVERFKLSKNSIFAEIASNDGYLLQYVKELNINCYGVEPTKSTANIAKSKGIDIIEDFFTVRKARELVNEGRKADLIAANNVLAHVPDINNFVKAFDILLKPDGVATFEFPHIYNLVKLNQFDTIYHEHYSYLSLLTVNFIFEKNGLKIFDVEKILTHGGSLRIFAKKKSSIKNPLKNSVLKLFEEEKKVGLNTLKYYENFKHKVNKIKLDALLFLIKAKLSGKKIAAYGAAAKGNTFLNFIGAKPDLISYVVDKNPAKYGKYMPGSCIPIYEIEHLLENKPDYIMILPWNLSDEILSQETNLLKQGVKCFTAIPKLKILN